MISIVHYTYTRIHACPRFSVSMHDMMLVVCPDLGVTEWRPQKKVLVLVHRIVPRWGNERPQSTQCPADRRRTSLNLGDMHATCKSCAMRVSYDGPWSVALDCAYGEAL